LCIAIIALLRPAVPVPHAALESMVALLDAEDGSAVFAIGKRHDFQMLAPNSNIWRPIQRYGAKT